MQETAAMLHRTKEESTHQNAVGGMPVGVQLALPSLTAPHAGL